MRKEQKGWTTDIGTNEGDHFLNCVSMRIRTVKGYYRKIIALLELLKT